MNRKLTFIDLLIDWINVQGRNNDDDDDDDNDDSNEQE